MTPSPLDSHGFLSAWTCFPQGGRSGVGQSVRNGAPCFVAGGTSIKRLCAPRFAEGIPIDAPECTQLMLGSLPNRCAKDRDCVPNIVFRVGAPKITVDPSSLILFCDASTFTAVAVCRVVCSPCLYRPGSCWTLFSRNCGIARGFHARAVWRNSQYLILLCAVITLRPFA